ncbi:uncharacterized protein Dvar_03160 [Desulfosarcina variabilis str. Montpellier]
MKWHPLFIAQHAIAICCRGCLWKWNRIEKGRPLTEDEVRIVVELVMGWIDEQTRKLHSNNRLPSLKKYPASQ